MTDEQLAFRAKAIDAMVDSARWQFCTGGVWELIMTVAFDALHGVVRVVPLEATKEMIDAAALAYADAWKADIKKYLGLEAPSWNKMGEEQKAAMLRCASAALKTLAANGDLTKPPETE